MTGIEAVLKKEVDDSEILKAIHPTPAVGGVPTSLALKLISREPFKRGWYSGPVGYVGSEMTEFAVGIRSALVQDRKVSLYAGAGIVEGSTSQAEWNEIETKISNFVQIFENGTSLYRPIRSLYCWFTPT